VRKSNFRGLYFREVCEDSYMEIINLVAEQCFGAIVEICYIAYRKLCMEIDD
jgi:hypothetical protein